MQKNISLILSLSFLLFLLGTMGLSLLTGYGLLDYWKQKLQVIVELRDDIEENELEALHIKLETAAYVSSNSLNIITKDEASDLMKKEFGQAFLSPELENPLRNIYTFNVQADFTDDAKLENIKNELLLNNVVADVFYEKKSSHHVVKNISNLLIYAFGLAILFVFVAVFLIRQHHIITWLQEKPNILNSEERDTLLQESKKNHLWQSFKNGLWSGAIAVIGLIGFHYWLNANLTDIALFLDNRYVIILFVSLMIISVLCYFLTTFFMQKKVNIDSY